MVADPNPAEEYIINRKMILLPINISVRIGSVNVTSGFCSQKTISNPKLTHSRDSAG
jgi:hypothetical protein